MYIRQYYGLMIFLAAFVVCYILLMHRPNSPLFNKLREPTALLGFGIEIVTIVYFTLMFRTALRPILMSWSCSGPIRSGSSIIMQLWGWRS